jgi:hypothetical protein
MTGDAAMAIGNAVERDQFVCVYDEKRYDGATWIMAWRFRLRILRGIGELTTSPTSTIHRSS